MSHSRVAKSRGGNAANVPEMETTERLATSGELSQELLPGIPQDLTLQLIAPKLSWGDLQILSTVSRVWEHTLEGSEIYDARVRSDLTETFIILNHDHSQDYERTFPWDLLHSKKVKLHRICLYSIRENFSSSLPCIPGLRRGIPASCQCVSLDGVLYVLGGAVEPYLHSGSKRVFMLDLARNAKQWKRCPDMLEPRLSFGAGVIDGKIYVFGGTSGLKPVFGSEVYDPQVNAWSPIKRMLSLRFNHQVIAVGDELLVLGGVLYETWSNTTEVIEKCALAADCTEDACYCEDSPDGGHVVGPHHIRPTWVPEVYHPIKNEWRFLENSEFQRWHVIFTAQGKLHSMDRLNGIRVHDFDTQSVTPLHSFSSPYSELDLIESPEIPSPYSLVSFGLEQERYNVDFKAIAAVAANDDILVVATWNGYWEGEWDNLEQDSGHEHQHRGSCLVQGKGFGFKNKDIVWENKWYTGSSKETFSNPKFSHSSPFRYTSPILCPIRL